MSYKLDYNSIITLPVYDDTGLIQKNLNNFHLEDFTVIVGVKPDVEDMLSRKEKEDSKASCIFGRPGQHFGIFFGINDNRFKFSWFDISAETGEPAYNDISSEPIEDVSKSFTITVQHRESKKEFSFYVNEVLQGKKKYNQLLDYTNTPIFIGVANPEQTAIPYQEFFSGDLEYFILKDKVTRSKLVDSDTLVAYDFLPENTTYYSIYDISKNGNRARINHHTYMPV